MSENKGSISGRVVQTKNGAKNRMVHTQSNQQVKKEENNKSSISGRVVEVNKEDEKTDKK